MGIELLPLAQGPARPEDTLVHELADVLRDCVDGGASVGFGRPLALDRALDWWRTSLCAPATRTWVARGGAGRIEGCVQLSLAGQDNARHRAEVAKLLVHRRSRGSGHAAALMGALEQHARHVGRTRLLLDTQTGSVAERVYERWGWVRVGVVPDYAADPDGVLAPTTFMTKDLR
ncbi:GNAT superfamily N-acetyltransferase [Nocardioides marinisabuli]|uniref:GNAT superfamily N-acetyltransferase n=1 Tax=Nocardioides marinisabuli TaxID=419476 RepID=A0A7Y9F3D7_9ACTN|nr:GNAT family N-acetyltransferase [Nocardioides marinisabuli]NYD58773.1 GNAT superfamily N-acetyltransferase [Nocardioides marinisabuli]